MRLAAFIMLTALAAAATAGCAPECHFDTDCEGTGVCVAGQCAEPSLSDLTLGVCETHADCAPTERCRGNRCEARAPECTDDEDCPTGQVCQDESCVDDEEVGEGCPSRPSPPPCEGHSADCPCIAGNYRFLPKAGCDALEAAAVTLFQEDCEISFMVGNFAMTGAINQDGEVSLMGDLLRCNATAGDGDSGFELDCQGCIVSMEPFLPPQPTVEIRAGAFHMGSDNEEAAEHEGPMHEVEVSCYRMQVIEVTNRHYHECVYQPHNDDAVLCDLPEGISHAEDLLHPDLADLPVMGITYTNADRYCAMRGMRLPTEAQWEKAARGDEDARDWPWGDDAANPCAYDHFDGCVPAEPIEASQTSGTSPYGVKNMAGNVRNWVRDAWSDTVYQERVDAGEVVEDPSGPSPAGNPERVIRGGSYLLPVGESQVFRRRKAPVADVYTDEMQDVGLRCVR